MLYNRRNHPLTNAFVDLLHSSVYLIDSFTRHTNAVSAQIELSNQIVNESRQERKKAANRLQELAESTPESRPRRGAKEMRA